jgi:fructosamine-3-kinase
VIPEAVTRWITEGRAGRIVSQQPVGGGCINNGMRLVLDSGVSYFLKTNPNAPKDMFLREKEGLESLMNAGGPRVPIPLLWGSDFILLEDLKPAKKALQYWEKFGQKLAELHRNTNSKFGFDHDNYLGSTIQKNPWTENGYEFFADHRLGFQVRLARDNGFLTTDEAAQITTLANKLPSLVPQQPASLIHGDLWSGNAITDEHGQPAIIDPATHYGWAEAELAMTALFGGFPSIFYNAYMNSHPLEAGWEDRLPIYNLYQLLNHLNLFGMGYHGQVMEIANRFA